MKKEELLKVVAWLGIILIVMAFATSDAKTQQSYLFEAGSMALVLLYAYGKIKMKTLIMVLAAFFSIVYAFVNFSLMDLVYWVAVFAFVY